MSDDFNIVVVGSSGSGKTCYLLAMYAVMSSSLNGFTFVAQDLDDDLELSERWENIVERGEFELPTSVPPRTYHLDFSYGVRKIMGFTWVDYPGGLLDQHQNAELDGEDARAFLAQIGGASCVMLCVAADELAAYVRVNTLPKGVRRFNAIMHHFAVKRSGTIPVIVAITKADQWPAGLDIDKAMDALIKGVLSAFFVDDPVWSVLFIPVQIGALDSPKGTEVRGHIEPNNVHLPISHGIGCRLEDNIAEALAEQSRLDSTRSQIEAEVERRGSSGWGRFWNRNAIRLARERIEELRKESGLAEAEASRFRDDLRRLRMELLGPNIKLYVGGVLTPIVVE